MFTEKITAFRYAFVNLSPSATALESELLAMTTAHLATISNPAERRLFAATVTVAMYGHNDDLPGMLASIDSFTN